MGKRLEEFRSFFLPHVFCQGGFCPLCEPVLLPMLNDVPTPVCICSPSSLSLFLFTSLALIGGLKQEEQRLSKTLSYLMSPPAKRLPPPTLCEHF